MPTRLRFDTIDSSCEQKDLPTLLLRLRSVGYLSTKCLPALFLWPKRPMNTLFAIKTGMSAKFTAAGEQAGSTILSIIPMKVLDLRTIDKHGYSAVRLLISKPKSQITKEIRTNEIMEPGTEIKPEEVLAVGDKVSVSGITKGKGFTGAVKRWGFAGGPRTHGQSDREKAPGSSGATTTPGRVYKGKRRAGHMGAEKVTVTNLEVLELDTEKRQVVIKGSVPGANRYTLLTIKKLS